MPQSWQKRNHVVTTKNVSMMSLNARRRVDRLNEGERAKLELRAGQMERHLRILQHQQERVMASVHRTRNELLAYRTLLNTEFKADQFHTLRFGYDAKAAHKDPEEKHRLGIETKIFHSGFSRQVLRKKIDHHVLALIPENQNKEIRQRKLEQLKQKNAPFIVDRHTKSLTIIFNKFSQHKKNPGLALKEKYSKLPSIEPENITEEKGEQNEKVTDEQEEKAMGGKGEKFIDDKENFVGDKEKPSGEKREESALTEKRKYRLERIEQEPEPE